MRILYIVTAFERYEGDVITPWLTETIRQLKNRGIDISVFVSSYKGLGDQKLYGIDVIRFKYFFPRWENLTHEETTPDRLKKGIRYKLLVPFYLIGGMIGIMRLCKRENYDIIHVHWPFPHAIFGYIGKRLCNAKMLSNFHGVELRWVKTKMPLFLRFIRWAIRESDCIIANSIYTAREIKDVTKCDVTVIPFGVRAQNSREQTCLFPTRVRNNILFVGRLVERKGVKYLIKAYEIVSKKIDTTLTIVGEGAERGNLEQLVTEMGLSYKVKFMGRVSEAELKKYYRDCAVFVLPACTDSKGDTEGLGVVLIEAMNYKKPVIASQTGGIVDIVKDGETGLLVPEKDSEKLAEAIIKILNNPALASRLAGNGEKFVKLRFGWDKIIDDLICVYLT